MQSEYFFSREAMLDMFYDQALPEGFTFFPNFCNTACQPPVLLTTQPFDTIEPCEVHHPAPKAAQKPTGEPVAEKDSDWVQQIWLYQTDNGMSQEPFTFVQIREWCESGFHPMTLPVKRIGQKETKSVGDTIQIGPTAAMDASAAEALIRQHQGVTDTPTFHPKTVQEAAPASSQGDAHQASGGDQPHQPSTSEADLMGILGSVQTGAPPSNLFGFFGNQEGPPQHDNQGMMGGLGAFFGGGAEDPQWQGAGADASRNPNAQMAIPLLEQYMRLSQQQEHLQAEQNRLSGLLQNQAPEENGSQARGPMPGHMHPMPPHGGGFLPMQQNQGMPMQNSSMQPHAPEHVMQGGSMNFGGMPFNSFPMGQAQPQQPPPPKEDTLDNDMLLATLLGSTPTSSTPAESGPVDPPSAKPAASIPKSGPISLASLEAQLLAQPLQASPSAKPFQGPQGTAKPFTPPLKPATPAEPHPSKVSLSSGPDSGKPSSGGINVMDKLGGVQHQGSAVVPPAVSKPVSRLAHKPAEPIEPKPVPVPSDKKPMAEAKPAAPKPTPAKPQPKPVAKAVSPKATSEPTQESVSTATKPALAESAKPAAATPSPKPAAPTPPAKKSVWGGTAAAAPEKPRALSLREIQEQQQQEAAEQALRAQAEEEAAAAEEARQAALAAKAAPPKKPSLKEIMEEEARQARKEQQQGRNTVQQEDPSEWPTAGSDNNKNKKDVKKTKEKEAKASQDFEEKRPTISPTSTDEKNKKDKKGKKEPAAPVFQPSNSVWGATNKGGAAPTLQQIQKEQAIQEKSSPTVPVEEIGFDNQPEIFRKAALEQKLAKKDNKKGKKEAPAMPVFQPSNSVWGASKTTAPTLQQIQKEQAMAPRKSPKTSPKTLVKDEKPSFDQADDGLFWSTDDKKVSPKQSSESLDKMDFPSLAGGDSNASKKKKDTKKKGSEPAQGQAELTDWAQQRMKRIKKGKNVDDSILVSALLAVNSAEEVRSYVAEYLGTTKDATNFAEEFISLKSFGVGEGATTPNKDSQAQKKKKLKGKAANNLLNFSVAPLPGDIETG